LVFVASALRSFFGRPRFGDGSGSVSIVVDADFFVDSDLLALEPAALDFVAPFAEAFAARGAFFVTVRLTTLAGALSSSAAIFFADCTAFLGERRNTVAVFWTLPDFLPFLGVSGFDFAMTWECFRDRERY
jgi:hypothetical protein